MGSPFKLLLPLLTVFSFSVGRCAAADDYRAAAAFRLEDHFGFPHDNTGEGGRTYTKSTNVGLDLISTLAAVADGLETPESALAHARRLTAGIETLPTHRGLFPEYIHFKNGRVIADVQGGRVRCSSIDSAWLHFALALGAAHFRAIDPSLAGRMAALVDRAEYKAFVHGDGPGFSHGFTVSADMAQVLEAWPHDYDNLNSEARVLLAFLTAAGKTPRDLWERMTYRWAEAEGLPVAEGYAMSAFVELIGNVYFDEAALAPGTLGLSHANHLAASEHIAARRGLALFGWAPCFTPEDRYGEYGLGRVEVVTPYAAALLATVDREGAAANLRSVLARVGDLSQPYPDALDAATGAVLNRRALALNQNLFFQARRKDAVRRLVARAPWGEKAAALIAGIDARALNRKSPKPEDSGGITSFKGAP